MLLKRYKALSIVSNLNNVTCYFTTMANHKPLAISSPEIPPEPAEPSKPLIACKRPEFNFFGVPENQKQKYDDSQLASKSWTHRKSVGDYFTLFPKKEGKHGHTSPGALDPWDRNISYEKLGIDPSLIKILEKLGIKSPTSVQIQAIPTIFTGKNCVIGSQTGSGKTLAYLLPMLQRLAYWKRKYKDREMNSPLAVILLPSRELAEQITAVVNQFGATLNINSHVIIGGNTKRLMMDPDFGDCDLLIATLGAISKLTTTGIYRMSNCLYLCMDEADTLLDDSFIEKLQYFLKHFRLQFGGLDTTRLEGTQLILSSATTPTNITEALQNIVPPESLVHVTVDKLHHVMDHVPQKFLRVHRSDKPFELLKLVKDSVKRKESVMIFSNKASTSDWVSLFLNSNDVECANLNGDMPFKIRQGTFKQFQDNFFDIISCTDIASRGLNTLKVKHVINYDFPLHTADYIHRAGRTGRLGGYPDCRVTNLVCGAREVEIVKKIEEAVRQNQRISNVDGNITQVIAKNMIKSIQKDISNINKM